MHLKYIKKKTDKTKLEVESVRFILILNTSYGLHFNPMPVLSSAAAASHQQKNGNDV